MDGIIKVKTEDLTFDIERGADGKIYLIVEGVGVFAEEVMSEGKAYELGKAFMDAAKVSL